MTMFILNAVFTLALVVWALYAFTKGGSRMYSGNYGQSRPNGSLIHTAVAMCLTIAAWLYFTKQWQPTF